MEEARIFREAFHHQESEEKGAGPEDSEESPEDAADEILLRFGNGSRFWGPLFCPHSEPGMRKLSGRQLLFLLSVLLLPGCTANPPTLRDISLLEYWSPGTGDPELTHFALEVILAEPDGAEDIQEIRIEHISSQLFWSIPAADLDIEEAGEDFLLRTAALGFLPIGDPHAAPLPLGSYSLKLTDLAGQEDSRNFTLRRLGKDSLEEGLLTPAQSLEAFISFWEGKQGEIREPAYSRSRLLVLRDDGRFQTLISPFEVEQLRSEDFAQDRVILIQSAGYEGGYAYWMLQ